MKKEYFSPEFELVKFEFEDINLTDSVLGVNKNDGDDVNAFEKQ